MFFVERLERWEGERVAKNRNVAKNHHYVPQGYLKGFANDKGQIRVVPLDKARTRYTPHVRNVASRSHFYRIDHEESDAIEKFLSEVEAAAIPIIRRIAEGEWRISEEERWTLSYFLSAQVVRGPDTRESSDYLLSSMVRLGLEFSGREKAGQFLRDNFGVELSEAEVQGIWDKANSEEEIFLRSSRNYHLDLMFDMAEKLSSYMVLRPWVFIRFERRALLTSDAPVSLIPSLQAKELEGVGFSNAWAIVFPVSRRVAILMIDPLPLVKVIPAGDKNVAKLQQQICEGIYDGCEVGTTEREKFINASTLGKAREYVYCHPEDERFIPEELPEPDLINFARVNW